MIVLTISRNFSSFLIDKDKDVRLHMQKSNEDMNGIMRILKNVRIMMKMSC